MFLAKYSSTVNNFLVSVLKNVSGCSRNHLSEVYTNRSNHSFFTQDLQKSLKHDFEITYNAPTGNDPIIDDTGLTWTYSTLKLDPLIDCVQRNATTIKDLLYIIAAKETATKNPNRLVLVPKNLVNSALAQENFLKLQFNIRIIVDFPVFHNCYSDDVDLTWNSEDSEEGLLLNKLLLYLS